MDKDAKLKKLQELFAGGFDLGRMPLAPFLIEEEREVDVDALPSAERRDMPEDRVIEEIVEDVRTPYPELNFRNIVEKQAYWDSLPGIYGEGVRHRQDYLDSLNRPINTESYKEEINPPGPIRDRLPQGHPAREDKNYRFRFDIPASQTSWRDLIGSRDDIDNKALFYASMMDEGAATMNLDSVQLPIDGFEEFGLDRITERVDEFEDKGYLPKGFSERIVPIMKTNEKGGSVISAYFYSLDDAITAKNAYVKAGQDNVDSYAKQENLNLSSTARDFFTIASYNYGESGTRRMMKYFKDEGLLDDDRFLNQEPEKYKSVYRNVIRRMQAAEMVKGEGFFKE